jgi:hypothetical protein
VPSHSHAFGTDQIYYYKRRTWETIASYLLRYSCRWAFLLRVIKWLF